MPVCRHNLGVMPCPDCRWLNVKEYLLVEAVGSAVVFVAWYVWFS